MEPFLIRFGGKFTKLSKQTRFGQFFNENVDKMLVTNTL